MNEEKERAEVARTGSPQDEQQATDALARPTRVDSGPAGLDSFYLYLNTPGAPDRGAEGARARERESERERAREREREREAQREREREREHVKTPNSMSIN